MSIKITVIGGSGFVGTNLCRLFQTKRRDFEIIDLKMSKQFPNKCKTGDVRDVQSLRNSVEGDIVINLAAIHRDDVKNIKEYYDTNVIGAENIATVCTEKGIKKIVFTSSVAVYGFSKCKTDETGIICPFNEYGKTKFEAEEKLRHWQAKSKRSLIIIRPTVIFGEGNRGNVFNLFNQIASGRFLMIGSGNNKKSLAYIGNVVAFIETCIESNLKYGVFNYVDTPDLTMNELVIQVRKKLFNKNNVGIRLPVWIGFLIGVIADGIAKGTKIRLPISSLRVRKFISSTIFLSSKEKLDNFVTPFKLNDGIERTLESEFISPDPNNETFYTE